MVCSVSCRYELFTSSHLFEDVSSFIDLKRLICLCRSANYLFTFCFPSAKGIFSNRGSSKHAPSSFKFLKDLFILFHQMMTVLIKSVDDVNIYYQYLLCLSF